MPTDDLIEHWTKTGALTPKYGGPKNRVHKVRKKLTCLNNRF